MNLIAAGFVDTPLSAAILGDQLDARREQLRTTLPIRRVVGPADIAALAVHLMTNTAVTGATFDIDGGQQLGRSLSLNRHDSRRREELPVTILQTEPIDPPTGPHHRRLSIRFAESEPRDDHALLLSPWPESLLPSSPHGPRLAEHAHLVAIDLPGFGQSERRET